MNNFFDYVSEIQKIEAEEERKILAAKERKRKKDKKNDDIIINNDLIYIPPGWKDNGLSFVDVVKEAKTLPKGKKAELSEEQKLILHNFNLLKSCYCTTSTIGRLAKHFIGKFNFEPYHNPYSPLNEEEFSYQGGTLILDGSSEEKDGFRLTNWPNTDRISTYVNPPFNRLGDAANNCNIYAGYPCKPSIAFMCTFDFNKWFKECLEIADYMIMLGRINFIPMQGVKTSSPNWNNAMFIYNSKIELDSQFINCDGNKYYCVNLKHNRKNKSLDQLSIAETE